MAITLITGLPGHGKTLYTLWRFKAEADKDQRAVFQCSGEADATLRKEGVLKPITGLKLPWPVIDPMKWHEAPKGSLVIIDEAQFVFPTRGRGEPPDWVSRLATHRHLGIDIVLITQGPMLLDSFVRSLVDRHFDVVRKFGTHFCTIHEYANGVHDNVRKSRGTTSIRHEWRYPKEVFGWYTSAEAHTVKRRIPMRIYLLVCVPFVFLGLVAFAYYRLNPDAQGARARELSGVGPAPEGGAVRTGHGAVVAPPPGSPAEVQTFLAGYAPRVPDLPHTAPVYDEVTKPVQAPYPAACVASATRCLCYSQQATLLQVAESLCRSIAGGGFFVAWQGSHAASAPGAAPARPDPANTILAAPQAVRLGGAGFGMFARPSEGAQR